MITGDVMKSKFLFNFVFVVAVWGLSFNASHAQVPTSGDYAATPPFLTDTTDPFVMISLSVELTQQAEAFTGATQTYANGTYCPGRHNGWSVCYSRDEEYIGYFDADKCYVYVTKAGTVYTGASWYDTNNITQVAAGPELSANQTTDYFRPVGFASNHECSGNQFSGNFMNWATMTALDEFRFAMTGGARLVDTAGSNAQTLLTRTHRYGDWPFVSKRIGSGGFGFGGHTFTNIPSNVTPFNVSELRIINNNGNNGNRVLFRDGGNNNLAELSVVVEVCDDSVGVEGNCVEYSNGSDTWYKPEGVLQKNAMNMRYALTSYTGEDNNTRNGGVLRTNAKYVGYFRPIVGGGIEVNPEAEINQYGQYVFHPDLSKLTADGEDLGGVNNSGLLNYINLFGLSSGRYKSFDPVGELYYEGLRYIMGLDPTPEYSVGAGGIGAVSDANKDNFPIIYENWEDPVTDSCQANYIVGIGDQFSHRDGNLPGSSYTAGGGVPTFPTNGAQAGFNVTSITNAIGILEGMGNTIGNGQATGRNNTYYVAGMAHWAATEDVRNGQGGSTVYEGEQNVRTFFVDTQEFNGNPPMREDNPLWLAAKYGGFIDANGDGDPNNGNKPNGGTTPATCGSTGEWDQDGDCEPEAYTLASQPANLVKGLNNAFNEISKALRSSSAAGVASNTASGEALVIQALYKSEDSDSNGNRVEWVGFVHSLFLDSYGNFREDTNQDGQLSANDNVIVFNSTDDGFEATVDLFPTSDNGATIGGTAVSTGLSIEDLNGLWNARDQLASVENYVNQRDYDAPANKGRYIFTAIGDSASVTSANVVDFDSTDISNASDGVSNNYRHLGLADGNTAEDVVNFIRGQEGITGFRSRTMDFDGSGVEKPWLLGDVVASSPVVVGTPRSEENYDAIYGDDSYLEFSQKYRNRRQVVYFGANDGMLHAVNAGFFNFATNQYQTSLNGEVAHPLGSELWAYVPSNLLPHLQWLTELSYPHVYYVDGIPQTFDVNIFPESETHPKGWGTILVVGMRFGGGDFSLDHDGDNSTEDLTKSSAYIIMDITDPEQPPTLIAEITHPLMGYTTPRPALVKSRPADENGEFGNGDRWHLVFGSGPFGDDDISSASALANGLSNQTAKVFAYDLDNLSFVVFGGDKDYLELTGEVNAFAGDFVAADWDEDFVDDAVYFGTVSGTDAANPGGSLMRLALGEGSSLITSATPSKVLTDVNKPFSGLPHVLNISGENWLFTGSGRFYVPEDNLSSGQQSYYGILEPEAQGSINSADLANVSDIEVQFVEGALNAPILNSDGTSPVNILVDGNAYTVSTFVGLRNAIKKGPGWTIDFDDLAAKHVGRSDSRSVTVGFSEYISTGDKCDTFGESVLDLVYFGTGTAAPFSASTETRILDNGEEVSERTTDIGPGLVRDVDLDPPVFQKGDGGLENKELWTFDTAAGRVSWREIIINW